MVNEGRLEVIVGDCEVLFGLDGWRRGEIEIVMGVGIEQKIGLEEKIESQMRIWLGG